MNGRLAWVTGAGGLLGNYLVKAAPQFAPNWRTRPLTRELDLTDSPAVRRAFETDAPALIIHCAALSKSPDCQRDQFGRVAQAESPKARRPQGHSARLSSTDLVFDGRKEITARTCDQSAWCLRANQG
jgi:dTDP-4-dehydrorhamnose reductase